MEQESYTPNIFARGLTKDSAKTIGIICPEIADDYIMNQFLILRSIYIIMDMDVFLDAVEHRLRKESYTKLMLSNRIDTLVFGRIDLRREPAMIRRKLLILKKRQRKHLCL